MWVDGGGLGLEDLGGGRMVWGQNEDLGWGIEAGGGEGG